MTKMAVINQKGGVGKTTTTANLGAALAVAGRRVLLIDLDPQTHLTLNLDADPDPDRPSTYDVLVDNLPLDQVVAEINPNLHLVPSNIDLAAAETELSGVPGRELRLRRALEGYERGFDFLLIDCPPSLGLLTINALTASHQVLVPLQPHFLALQGVGKLFETVAMIRERLNPQLSVAGILLCLYESGTRLASEVHEDIRQFLEQARGTETPWANAKLYNTVIRRNIKLAEAPSHGQSIFDYEPRCNGAIDYRNLAAEVLGEDPETLFAPKNQPASTPYNFRMISRV